MNQGRMTTLLRLTGRTLILAAVILAPWLFGGVQAKVQVGLYAVVLGALAIAVIDVIVSRSRPIRFPLVLWPLVIALLVGVVQLVPVSRSVRALLSPSAVALTDSLAGRPESKDESWVTKLGIAPPPARQPVSLYPASSRHDLALLLMAVGVFFVGFVLFRQPDVFPWFCGIVAANGAAIAFFGMVQRLSWNGLIYWSVPLRHGGKPFGPFVNRNNAGGYLLLCLGAAVALVTWSVHRYFSDGDMWLQYRASEIHSWRDRAKQRLGFILANLNATVLTVFAGTGLLATGVLATLSRGAAVAMVVAMVVTLFVALVLRKQRGVVVWLITTVVVGALLLAWMGMGQQVRTRLATLLDSRTAETGRLPHWHVGIQAARDFQRLGSGLGTYRFVYPRYQKLAVRYWYYHAENQYLEALVEQGIIGLCLMLAALLFITRDAWSMLRGDHGPLTLAFAVGGVLAIVSQAISSLFDFGLYIPSNVMLFALLCGAIVGRATDVRVRPDLARRGSLVVRRLLLALLGAGLLAGGVWGLGRIRAMAAVETALADARRDGALTGFSVPVLKRHVGRLQAAARWQPDDAELCRELAKLWSQLYRAETSDALRKKTTLPADAPQLKNLTSLLALHQRIHFLARARLARQLANTRALSPVRDDLVPALKQFLIARQNCPLLPAVQCGIAQLCGVVTDPNADASFIARTRELAPASPHLLFICAVLDYNAGRVDAALAGWKACLTCSPLYLRDMVQVMGGALADPELVSRTLPDSPTLLVDLAHKDFSQADQAVVRKTLLDRAWQLLDKVSLPAAERAYVRATIAADRGATELASTAYRKAIRLRPDRLEWRYEYALFLHKQGDLEAAIEHVLVCTRMDPYEPKYSRSLKAMRGQQWRRPEN